MPSKGIYRRKSINEMREDLMNVLTGKVQIIRRTFIIEHSGDKIQVNNKQISKDEFEKLKETFHPQDTVIQINVLKGCEPIVEIKQTKENLPSWVSPLDWAKKKNKHKLGTWFDSEYPNILNDETP